MNESEEAYNEVQGKIMGKKRGFGQEAIKIIFEKV